MKVKYKIMNMGQAMNAFGITVEDLRRASGLDAEVIEDIIADRITVSFEVAFVLQKIFRGNITILQCIGNEEGSDTVSEDKVAKETAEEIARRRFNEVKSVFEKEVAELLKLKDESGERFAAAVKEIEMEFKGNKIKEEQEKKAAEEKKKNEAAAKNDSAKTTTSSTPSSGMAAGPTYVSNINIPGQATVSIKYSDANSQRAGDDLIRKLATGKGVAQ